MATLVAESKPSIPLNEQPLSAALPRMTEAEFEEWCDEDVKAEWVNGEVIVHSPASYKHVKLNGFLNIVLRGFAEHHGLGEVLGPELQIRMSSIKRRRVPDLLFLKEEHRDRIRPTYIDGVPDLAVEIVSVDSVARDWRIKFLEYQAAGIPEYWTIDPNSQVIEVHVLDESGQYQRIEENDGMLKSTVLTGFYLKPEWLWQEPLPNPLDILKELEVVM